MKLDVSHKQLLKDKTKLFKSLSPKNCYSGLNSPKRVQTAKNFNIYDSLLSPKRLKITGSPLNEFKKDPELFYNNLSLIGDYRKGMKYDKID
jgi:hypothetical protein